MKKRTRGPLLALAAGLFAFQGLLGNFYLHPKWVENYAPKQQGLSANLNPDQLLAALAGFRDAMLETKAMGFDAAKAAQFALGKGARALLAAYGHKPLAAEGFGAPGVVVCYTGRPELQNGSAFAAAGYQIAAGVPLMVGEGEGFRTFRIGLFGLDKLKDVPGTLARLDAALKAVA